MSDNMDTQITQPKRPAFGLKLQVQETTSGGDISMFDGDSEMQATGSGGGFGGAPMLQLNGSQVDLNASYQVSATGTLRTQGFVIKQDGIASQPVRRVSASAPGAGYSSASSPSGFAASRAPSSLSPAAGMTPGLDGELAAFNPKDLSELGISGKGACGVVKRAMHVPSLQIVALKQIKIFEKDKRAQFVKELTALSSVNSPYIVGFSGATYSEGSITLMLEYSNRLSLLEVLKTYGAFDELFLQRIALHTFRGLELLHGARVIHRDLKPGNILCNSNGECKLTDFGVVTALEGTMDLASTFVGTTVFMGPERISQDGKYSYASDIWSVGVSLHYMATGVLPYSSEGGYWGIVKSIRDEPAPQLPPVHPVSGRPYSAALRDFLTRVLAKDPAQRLTAAAALGHPFLATADATWSAALAASPDGILHPLMRVTDTDLSDLDAVLTTVYRAQYAGGRSEYRKSLLEQARFQKLAENLNNRHITPELVRSRFEAIYARERQAEGK